jgi:sulfite exporter TauE/SafE
MELIVAALAAGLLGGIHCIGMCGGIAGTLACASGGRSWPRLLLINAGRIGSYADAGGIAGALGSALTLVGPVHAARTTLFVAAQLMLIALGLYIAGATTFFPRLETLGGALWSRIGPLRRRVVPIDTPARALAAGALWGWVPCGLVYGMLPFAVASGGPAQGALTLLAFGAGTLPALLAAGTAGLRLATFRRNPWIRRAACGLVVVLATASLAHLPATHEVLALAWLCLTPAL